VTSRQQRCPWLSLLLLSVLVCANAFAVAAQQSATTTVILVRHAEKGDAPANDPVLTEAGAARARALMAIARDAGVTAVITTQFARTRETARPAVEALGITPDVARAGGVAAQHAQDVARMVQAHAGGVVLVVGHSNTVPAIVAALGAPQPPPICDSEYDGLYIVVVPATGPAHLIRGRYGQPSPVDATCASMRP
jgi:broad specificity phosphatase PhoE